jgi:hypothetical protein
VRQLGRLPSDLLYLETQSDAAGFPYLGHEVLISGPLSYRSGKSRLHHTALARRSGNVVGPHTVQTDDTVVRMRRVLPTIEARAPGALALNTPKRSAAPLRGLLSFVGAYYT